MPDFPTLHLNRFAQLHFSHPFTGLTVTKTEYPQYVLDHFQNLIEFTNFIKIHHNLLRYPTHKQHTNSENTTPPKVAEIKMSACLLVKNDAEMTDCRWHNDYSQCSLMAFSSGRAGCSPAREPQWIIGVAFCCCQNRQCDHIKFPDFSSGDSNISRVPV